MKDIIIGIDPGSRHTGYGVIAVQGDDIEHLTHGVIHLKEAWSLPERLKALDLRLREVFSRYKASTTVVEKIFFGKNADSAFKLGHARGVALLVSAQHDAHVAEYAARYVKKCITGSGAASKEEVQLMILNTLRLRSEAFAFDASDALALAVTHARIRDVNAKLQRFLEETP